MATHVHLILTTRSRPEIRSSIIQTISIDMVNNHVLWHRHYVSVHVPDGCSGIYATMTIVFHTPFPLIQELVVFIIDYCFVPLC
jgi:hypothetical protein